MQRSASRATSNLMRARSVTSTSKVSSTDTDLVSRSATTGRSSTPRAMRCSEEPWALPSSRSNSSSPACTVSPTVVMPALRSTSAVAGPTPGSVRTGMGASSSRSVPGSISTRPSGLACSEAILASILEPARPTEPVTPVASRIRARSRSPVLRASSAVAAVPPAARSTNASSRLSGSTSGDSSDSRPITVSLIDR